MELDASIAQLGERQTEDLKVPGSIPGRGTFSCFWLSFWYVCVCVSIYWLVVWLIGLLVSLIDRVVSVCLLVGWLACVWFGGPHRREMACPGGGVEREAAVMHEWRSRNGEEESAAAAADEKPCEQ